MKNITINQEGNQTVIKIDQSLSNGEIDEIIRYLKEVTG